MLTAHQRLAIKSYLPEVEQVSVREDRDVLDVSWIRLELRDGWMIVIYGPSEDGCRCRRSRLADDYSDRLLVEPIPAEMQERLMAVFGRLRFDR